MERNVFGTVVKTSGGEVVVAFHGLTEGSIFTMRTLSQKVLEGAGISCERDREFVAGVDEEGALSGFAPMPRCEELENSSV